MSDADADDGFFPFKNKTFALYNMKLQCTKYCNSQTNKMGAPNKVDMMLVYKYC